MEFTRDPDAEDKVGALLLRPRSLLVFDGAAYTQWYHSIALRHQDLITEAHVNRVAAAVKVGDSIARSKRLSITMRYSSQPQPGDTASACQHIHVQCLVLTAPMLSLRASAGVLPV